MTFKTSTWALVALGTCIATACGDDTTPSTTNDNGGSDSGSSSGTGGGPTTMQPVTTVDPDSSGGSGGVTGGSSGTMGETDSEDETTVGAECGNDMAEGDEQCDGTDLAGQDCVTQGFDAGDLACNDDCTFDSSSCMSFTCGDDTVEGDEACDGTDLAGETCLTQGFDEGTLACARNCMDLDTSGCVMYSCGNDMQEGMEVCDGTDLVEETCLTQGFDEGTLACAADCMSYDTTGCVMYMCGNDMLEGMELCDGTELGGETCVTQGFNSGTLACAGDCMSYDTTGCAICGDDTIGGDEVCDGIDLAMEDCISQGFEGGVLGCAADCGSYDTSGCTACGNDLIEGMEVCDGTDLGGETCESQGFDGGALGCAIDCGAYDTSGCCAGTDIGSAVGFAVAVGTNLGAGDDQQTTCTGTAGEDVLLFWTAPATQTFNIDTLGSDFDTVVAVLDDCGGMEIGCNDQAFGTNQSSMILDATAGTTYAIVVDGWNSATGNFILNITESNATCTDTDIGNGTGTPVTDANDVPNAGALDDTQGTCTASVGEDVAYAWIAPATGTFQFDTFNSNYDTVLYVLDGCGGAELGCNDQAGGTDQSSLTLPVTAGVPYVVVVDGWDGSTGLHDLNINPFLALCADLDVGGALGSPVATGGNAGGLDDTQGSCSATTGEDVVIQWTAPYTGDVVIDTFNSDFDTVLYVLDDCGGVELACNDQAGGTNQSELTLAATAGTTYQIVIDGWTDATGNIELNINPPLGVCADANIGSFTGAPVAQGTNAGAIDDLQPTCTGMPGEELAVQWVAPASGSYTLDTFNSDFDTVLYVLDTCGGVELACNDQAAGTNQSELTFDAVAGTTYVVVVDGWNNATGNFDLNINGPF